MSEHGQGNAMDVGGFVLEDKRVLDVKANGLPFSLQAAMKASACTGFSTVLGPGSDGYHEDHVHVDMAVRRLDIKLCRWKPEAARRAHDHAGGRSVPGGRGAGRQRHRAGRRARPRSGGQARGGGSDRGGGRRRGRPDRPSPRQADGEARAETGTRAAPQTQAPKPAPKPAGAASDKSTSTDTKGNPRATYGAPPPAAASTRRAERSVIPCGGRRCARPPATVMRPLRA